MLTPTRPCRSRPANTPDTAWLPCLHCVSALATLPQCPSAQSSLPQTALLYALTFLLHGACYTVLVSLLNTYDTCLPCWECTHKVAEVFTHHWNPAQGPTHYRCIHMTLPFLGANLIATYKPKWLLVLSLNSEITKGLYNISKNSKLVIINGYSNSICNHYISEVPWNPTVMTPMIRPIEDARKATRSICDQYFIIRLQCSLTGQLLRKLP